MPNKSDFLAILNDESQQPKPSAIAVTGPDFADTQYQDAQWFTANVKNIVAQLVIIAPNKSIKARRNAAETLGGEYGLQLMQRFPADFELDHPYVTACFYVTKYRNDVKDELERQLKNGDIDSALKARLNTTLGWFNDALNLKEFSASRKFYKQNYDKRVIERQIDAAPICYQSTIDWATDTLQRVVDGDEKVTASEVSIAVAVATGRRCVEIHCTGEFSPTSDARLMSFKGQAKGKDRKVIGEEGNLIPVGEHTFTIPVLCHSGLVMAGLRYLDDAGKRYDKGDERSVNKRLSSTLNANSKKYADFLGDGQTTYHKYRAAYYAVLNCSNLYEAIYGEQLRATIKATWAIECLGDSKGMMDRYDRYEVADVQF